MKTIAEKEGGVSLEKGHFQRVIMEGLTEAQTKVDQGQDQEWVLTEIEQGVISVGDMITC